MRSFYEDTVAPLIRYDERYSTDLLGTLAAFLGNNCNMNAAGRRSTRIATPCAMGSIGCGSVGGPIRYGARIGSGWGSG